MDFQTAMINYPKLVLQPTNIKSGIKYKAIDYDSNKNFHIKNILYSNV